MKLNWSNALSLAGAATAQVGLEGVRSTLEQQKVELASRLAGERELASDTRRTAAEVARERRAPGLAAATETAVGTAREGLINKNAPAALARRVAEAEAVNAVNLKAEVEKFTKLAPLQRQEAIDTAVAKVKALSTPEMLADARKIALAGHIVDPSYSLIPNADGTVTTFDTKSGKSTGVVKDADGKPIVRKDPEEMKAAIAVINLSNTNLRIAEAAYKVDATSLEPGVKEKAAVAWEAAQREAKMLAAPAYAVLYGRAKIPGVSDKPDAPAATPADADIAKLKTNPKAFTALFDAKFGAGAAAKALGAKPGKSPEEPTTFIPPGGVDPNVARNERLRAERAAAEEKEIEERRLQRARARAADEGLISSFNRTLTR